MLSQETSRLLNSSLTAATGVGGQGLLRHLRDHIRKEARGHAELELGGKEIRFDTIQRVAFDASVAAYRSILDDPAALEALKKMLESG